MRNRSGIQGVASSPVIVGAVTVLVVIVAVFLAYNANNGLPFVSTYDLKARVPNANALVKGNEVRIGGSRVGVVRGVKPIQLGDGRVAAELDLKLDKSAEPIPANSTMIIRPKSPLGLKYLQIVPGDSDRGLKAGETIPVSAARPEPVDIDQFFDMFDEKTRTAIQRNNAGFGNAFAGRGPQVNAALGALRSLAENGQPVLRSLVNPSTNFGGFWEALEDLSATVVPVAETQASMFVALDRTFGAFARVSRPFIQETIVKGPPTLDAVTTDLPALRPFFRDSARFFTALKPGARALGETSPTINAALRAGIPALNRSPALYAQLTPTAEALLAFQGDAGVFNGLDLLIDTNELLDPAIKFIKPAQTTCNYLSLVFSNLADAFSESNGNGNWLGAIVFEPPSGPNAESAPASAPANGPEGRNHLHFNPYPDTGAPGQSRDCEAGNERFEPGQTVIGPSPQVWGTTTRVGQG
ncbi:MAG TPA: MlaD family protein [Solirubrobacterales bacterium]|nr:MlaD family protein [Solirubrobacterales bacterium]